MVQTTTVLWELILGSVLVLGFARPITWLATLLTFVVFAAVSGYLGWTGVADCGCFGVIKASPWHAFAVDVTALVLLAIPEILRFTHFNEAAAANIRLLAYGGILVVLTHFRPQGLAGEYRVE